MSKELESIKNKAKKIIINKPSLIKGSQDHRPDDRYVKVKGYRVYFNREGEAGDIIINDSDVYRPSKNKNSLLKIIFIIPILFILKILLDLLPAYRRKIAKRSLRKINRTIKDPWTYDRILSLKLHHFILSAFVLLIAIMAVSRSDLLHVPVRYIIALKLGTHMKDISYVGKGWYVLKKPGTRITAVDHKQEDLIIYINPANYLSSKKASAIIERLSMEGSDGLDYGTETIPVEVKNNEFSIIKYRQKQYGNVKNGKFFYSTEEEGLGTDAVREGKIIGEEVTVDESGIVIKDIY